ncbi:MAG TPA: uracil-DNA glycosylase [Methanomicrobia archaeon]|nr:uracil-DNA glycosylase [Methanomicrobia archaeon]
MRNEDALNNVAERVRSCTQCPLANVRTNAVPGEGPADARVMLVGQNPGSEEDRTGRPFVGRSGAYLDDVLTRQGIPRSALFITSIVKCTSPGNRRPSNEEVAACMPYLEAQVTIISPSAIVALGRVAQMMPHYDEIEYIETYHPAAAMRFPRFRSRFENDLLRVKTYVGSM